MPPPEMDTLVTPPRSRASSIRSRHTPRAPVLPRTTSQLSTVSVETRNHSSSPRKLLSKTYETANTGPAVSISVDTTEADDESGSVKEGVQADPRATNGEGSSAHASTSTPTSIPLSRSSSSGSRKGTERAHEGAAVEEAREALKHIKIGSSAIIGEQQGEGRSARRYYVLTNAGKPVWCSYVHLL